MGAMLFAGLLVSSTAQADGDMRTAKTLQSSQTLKVGEVVQYRLDFACDSLVGDCGSLTIIDNIPAQLEILGCAVPPGFTQVSCVPGSNYVEVTKDANFLDGDSFNMTIVTRVRLDLDPLPSAPIVNTADITISTGPDGNPLTQHPAADPVIVEPGEPQYKVHKARVDPAPPTLPAPDTGVTYSVEMCALNGTGNVDVTAPTLSDTFPAGAMLVVGALDEPTATVVGNNISWTLDDFDLTAYYATHDVSEQYCQSRAYVLVYPEAAFPAGTPISNTVIGDGDADGSTPFPGPGDDTATIDEETGPEAPTVSMSKYADDVLGGGGPMVWHLNADINLSNVPVLDLVLYEQIPQVPAAMFPLSVSSGTWNSILNFNGQSDVQATISYSTTIPVTPDDCSDLVSWVDLSGGQIASPPGGVTYPLPPNASCVRWVFKDVSSIPSAPAVPRGWDFGESPRLNMDISAVPGAYPVAVENCMYSYYDADGIDSDPDIDLMAMVGPVCALANIEGPTPAIDVLKTRITPLTDLNPGQEFTQRLSFVHIDGDSTGPVVNPTLVDLLPPELEFVHWDGYTGVGTEPAPAMEVIDNYNGTGRTMVRFSWSGSAPAGSVNMDLSDASGTDNSASFAHSLSSSDMPRMDLILQIKAGTPAGSYINEADLFDGSPIPTTCSTLEHESTHGVDLNGDGDTLDSFCAGEANFIVIEAAVLGGRKYVQGTQDPAIPNEDDPTSDPAIVDSACEGAPLGLTRFPCVAQTGRVAPNNDFHYELELVNNGNVFLEDYHLYDLMPKLGDTGSGPGLVNTPRLSTWEPELAGAITGVAGSFVDINGAPLNPTLYTSTFTIEYSTETNPCRNELEGDFSDPWPAGCSNNYSATLPGNLADVTAFRINIPFDILPWPPGAKMRFSVPMLAPPGSPPSFPGDANFFNPAWNSFAHRARADDGVPGAGGLANLSAEPRKVGIVLEPSYRLGNLIWLDSDHDGRAEQGEPGIAGVTIELWEDTDNTGDASAGDSFVQSLVTDTDGKYLFDDLHPGDYYVIVPDGQNGSGGPLEKLFQSQFGEEADPDGDTDNNDNGVNNGVTAGGTTTGLASGVVTLGVGGSYALSEPTNEQLRRNNATDDDHDYYPDALSNFSLDIGYYRPFNLGNRVWLDNGAGTQVNANNGLIDAGETGIDGIQVLLRNGNGSAYDADPDTAGTQALTTATSNGGYYLFENLPAGDYRVRIDLSGGNEHFKSSTGSNANVGPFEPAPDPDNPTPLDSADDGTHRNPTSIQSRRLTLGSSVAPVEPTAEADLDASLTNGQGDDPSGTGTALPDNQANMTVDFGLFESYSIGNRVWIEDDDNGVLDAGEWPVDGVAVRLYEDADANGVPDGAAIANTTTADGGHYRFDNVWAGQYLIEVDIPAGTRSSQINAVETHATDSDDNGVTVVGNVVRSATITVGPTGPTEVTDDAEYAPGGDGSDTTAAIDDHSNLTVDFGFVREYSIGSYVWNDLNGDGLQGNPVVELPLQNVMVELVDASSGLPVNDLDGALVSPQPTGADGEYFFSQLKSGDYKVRVTLPLPGGAVQAYLPSPVQTTVDNNDTANDSNIVSLVPATVGTYESGLFTLADGAEPIEAGGLSGDELDDSADANGNMMVDFGFYEPLTLGNLVWLDTDNDGLYNNGETGVNGVEVQLYRDDGDGNFEPGAGDALVNTTNTVTIAGVDGLYQFNKLLTGDYFVYIPDSEFASGQPLYRLVSSTGTGSGQPVAFEPAPDPDASDTDNDDSGSRDAANGGVVSAPVTLVANTEATLEDPSSTGIAGDDGTLVNGLPHDDLDSNLAVDFGFTPTMSIGSVVFSDDDDSGVQETGELGIPGVNLKLYRNSSNVEVPIGPDGIFGTVDDALGGMLTNAQGRYNFSGLSAGDYTVRVTPNARYAPSTLQVVDANLNVNLDSNIISESAGVYTSSVLTLVAYTEPTGAAENDPAGTQETDPSDTADNNGNLTLDFGFVPPVSIGSFVWLDQNGNSLQEPGEPGIPNATITLLNGLGVPVAVDMDGIAITPIDLSTGVVGQYLFDNLPPGDYQLRVITALGSGYLPALLQNTTVDDPANIENDSNIATIVSPNIFESAVFSLKNGTEPLESTSPAVEVGDAQDNASVFSTDDAGNMSIDFGFIRPVSIGSYVWEDSNGDGIQDSGENGIENATVSLFTAAGAPALDVLGGAVPPINTPISGQYQFINLPPGAYWVQVTPPASLGLAPSSTQTTVENNDANDSNIAGPGTVADSFASAVFNVYAGLEPVEAGGFDGDDADDGMFDFDGNMTIDFGFVQTVSMGSFVWEDLVINGIQDATEPSIENATVELFVDDGTGTFVAATDVDQVAVPNQSTLANGLYYFDNLPEGNYKVRVTPPSNFYPTPTQVGGDNVDTTAAHESDSNINMSPVVVPPAGSYESGVYTLAWGLEPAESNVEAGDDQDVADDLAGNMTVDFGFVQPVSIGSYVWEDSNGNGLQDALEPFVTRGIVSLVDVGGSSVTDLSGAAVADIDLATAANGEYFFDNLLPGDYRVRVTPHAVDAYLPTVIQTITDNDNTENDSNIASAVVAGVTYQSGMFTLSGGGEPTESGSGVGDDQDDAAIATEDSGNMSVDFGFVRPVSIGSYVWEDTNGNGTQESGEAPIENATVTLFTGAGVEVTTDMLGNAVSPITTTTTGEYGFGNLAPGVYKVQVSPPSGVNYGPSPTQTTTETDNDTDSNIAGPGSVAGSYFSANFNLNVGLEPNAAAETGAGDDADDGAFDADGNMTVDFGFVQSVSMGSYVWEDLDTDGVRDAVEPAVTGATVELFINDGTGAFIPARHLDQSLVAAVDTTATAGLYYFDSLPEGDYKVRVTPPVNYSPTLLQTGADNADTTPADESDSNINMSPVVAPPTGSYESGIFTLTSGSEPVESDTEPGDAQDAADDQSGNMTVDFGFVQPVSIGSYVWEDTNGNGRQDAGEPAITAGSVALVDLSGNPVTDLSNNPVSAINLATASNGFYFFDNLQPGQYRVRVTPLAGAGYVMTPTQTGTDDDDTENDSNIASEPLSGTYESGSFTLVGGNEPTESGAQAGDAQDNAAIATDDSGNMSVDFGFIRPLSIGSFVWEDTDDNGVQDGGEPGIEGAVISLLDGSDNPVTVDMNGQAILPQTTGINGFYRFSNLLPGDYKLKVEPPVALHLLPSSVQTSTNNNNADSDSNIASAGSGSYTSGLFTLSVGQEPDAANEAQAGDAQDDAFDIDGNMTVDFGFVPAMAIGSTVFLDIDNNALHDSGEPGMRAVVIELYVPGDVPGTDAPLANTITDVAGNYLFDNLRQGDYFVYIPTPPLEAPKSSIDIASSGSDNQTDGDDNGQQASSGDPVQSPLINLKVRAEPGSGVETNTGGNQDDQFELNGDMTIDFGFTPPASIGNRVWLDMDKDGAQDANEIGIANATVNLWIDTTGDDTPDTLIDSAITDKDGEYLFPDLEPGVAYEVRVDPASLHPLLVQTYDEGPTPGASGPLDHTSVVIILTPNEEHLTADFGYTPPSGTIGDTIWIDTDGDGLQDSGEIGIPGVTVNLLDVDGNLLETQVTDNQGKYLFTGLPAGIFGVVVDDTTLPAGYIAHPNGDPDVRDGIGFDHDNQTTVTLVVLPDTTISSNLDADFAYMPSDDQNNAIGNTIWNDIDGDGNGPIGAGDESDLIEKVFPGVTVSLYEDLGTIGALDSADIIKGTAVTDSDGHYQFTGLPDGNYVVVVTDNSDVLSEVNQVSGPDAVLDSRSYVDLDSAGTLPGLVNPDQDFGYTRLGDIDPTAITGVIGDTIFFDVNENGTQDAGDGGIEGVTVELYDDQGNLIDIASTDENGHYLFTELPVLAGGTDYRVKVRTSTLPGGGSSWNNSADPDGGFDSESLTTLTLVNLVDLDQDFGYGGGINALEGTIWSDENQDGVEQETEIFEGVTVELLDPATGNIIGRAITDSSGNYRFDGLPDGRYTVLVTDDNKVLVGYEHTDGVEGLDQNSQHDDGTYVVDLDSAGLSAAAVIDVTSDFGYAPILTTPITLGSFASEALSAGEVRFSWTTHSEIANVGFMIYQHADDGWIVVNKQLIPAVGESLDIEAYEFIGHQIVANEFVLVDVDSFGKQTVHGPFAIGEVFGTPEKLSGGETPDWETIGATPAGSAAKQRQSQQQFKSALDSYLGR